MLGFFLMVLFSEHINTAQASQLCLALLAISFLHIKCNFSARKWELIMGYIVLCMCFLKVPVARKLWREYNCIFGKSLWEDPHCCTVYTRAGSLEKEAPEEHMRLFCPYSGSVSAGKLLFIMLVL